MDLTILIVSWNVADLLALCVDSVFASQLNFGSSPQHPFTAEIIVVDSASADHTVPMLRERYPQIKLLPQTENVGFTRGNNIGLAQSQGRYILLLNPDTEVIGTALTDMIAYMDANPSVGIVGPHTFNSDRVTTQSTRRRFPTLMVGMFESTWFQPYAPKSLLNYFYAADQPDTGTFEVDWVQGSALMIRREVYEQIGGMDEGFIMYSEELDWCKRTKAAGWKVVYMGDAHIVHHGGKSTEQVKARSHIYFQQSKLRYFRKHHGMAQAQFLRAVLLLNYAIQIAIEGAKSLVGHKRELRRSRIQTYLQVIQSGLKVT